MTIGTRSVLYGAHQFLLHPLFVAWAWYKLYGFEEQRDPELGAVSLWNPRLWVAFFVHDLGYVGKPNMDGEEGTRHPAWGAKLMSRWFDTEEEIDRRRSCRVQTPLGPWGDKTTEWRGLGPWGRFTLYHSRYFAKLNNQRYSLLCVADKFAVTLEPRWLYLWRARASGEIIEYTRRYLKGLAGEGKYAKERDGAYGDRHELIVKFARTANDELMCPRCFIAAVDRKTGGDLLEQVEVNFHRSVTSYMREWVEEHRGADHVDTWTPEPVSTPPPCLRVTRSGEGGDLYAADACEGE